MSSSTAIAGPRHASPDVSVRKRLGGPLVVSIVAFGLLLVSISYAMARHDVAGPATACYWAGKMTIFAPIAVVAILRNRTRSDYYISVLALGVATGLSKWAYSPLQLKFPDENQHLLGTKLLLQYGRFGAPNPSLQLVRKYPGLEIVGGAISRLTGLSPEDTGLALGVVLHVVFAVTVFSLFIQVTGSNRGGLVATLLYACNADFGFFGSMYVYENLALPLAFAAIVMLYRATAIETDRARATAGYVLAAALFVGTLITHHLTVIFLCICFVAVAALAFRRRRSRWRGITAFAFAAGSLAVTVTWIALVAPETWPYLRPFVVHFGAVSELGRVNVSVHGRSRQLDTTPPTTDYVVAGAGLAVMSLLCLAGMVVAWRRRSRMLALLCLVSVLGLAAQQGARVASDSGSQISGRSGAFLYVPFAIAAAIVVIAVGGRRLWMRFTAAVLVCVTYAGGLMLAWPPTWDRMPRPAVLATQFERGYSPEGRVAAQWARYGLPRGSRVAADYMGSVDLYTTAELVGVLGDAPLFYSKRVNALDREILFQANIQYVWVNFSMSHIPTVNGHYYGNRGYAYSVPPSRSSLLKYERNPKDSKLFDDGLIAIYDVRPERTG